MAGFAEYGSYDALGLAELVKKGEVTPSELVEEAIDRIERLNPQLNAVVQDMYDIARERAAERTGRARNTGLVDTAANGVSDGSLAGPLQGVPFLLKDLLAAYAGVPMRAGSRLLNDYIPRQDSELVKRHKAAGLITVGKTNTPEFGLLPYTEPALFGTCNNPWDLTRMTGGSSGGSAAAVAARLVPMAHGGDGGGSIRIPASCCGVFGLKPSRGRNPTGPSMAQAWHGLASEHVVTRSVRDSAAMLDATAGVDSGAPYAAPGPERPFLDEVGASPGRLRIAFTTKPFLPGQVHADCVSGVEATAQLLQDLGHEVVEAAPPIDGTAFARAFVTMLCGETAADIEDAEAGLGRKAAFKECEPATWALALLGKQIGAARYTRAIRLLHDTGRKVGCFFEEFDVLLTPTLASAALPTGSLQPSAFELAAIRVLVPLKAGRVMSVVAGIDALADKVFAFMPFTPVFNATGQPAMSIPLHWDTEGLPIGMHFAARYGDEATLFQLAAQLEEARPWADRVPPVCAGA